MKKVKLMLLSFCVLAIVAGALAFKAKGGLQFCYAPANTSSPFCSDHGVIKACPTLTTNGKASTTAHLCAAATSGILGSECINVNCGAVSVASTSTE